MNIFDESIYCNMFTFYHFEIVNVFNKADKFILERQNHKISYLKCDSELSINPLNSNSAVNIYTVNKSNKIPQAIYHFFPIEIVLNIESNKDLIVKPLNVEIFQENVIYDYNKSLTSIESAIMIKYYSIKYNLKITKQLFYFIYEQFMNDNRVWFSNLKSLGNINYQTISNEIIIPSCAKKLSHTFNLSYTDIKLNFN